VKAVVMAGGEGTRLRPLTSNQPKPMVPIVGKPCMEHILELLRTHGFEEVVVTLAFMPQAIRGYFGDGEALGLQMDYSVEEQPLGTAGSVRLASGKLEDTFLVISGDALCDIDLGALVAMHREREATVTIGLKSVENPLEFGIVVTDEDGRVERFLEKPSWGQVFSDTINTGIYVVEPEALRHVPANRPYDFSKELFPLLLEMGRPIYGCVLEGYWQDIGNLEQFRQANFDALDERVRLEVPGIRLRGNVWIGEGVSLDDVDRIEGPAFIGNNCRIAREARVGSYTVLSNGVTLRDHARVARTVVDVGTHVGRSAVVEGAIVGRQCDIRDHVRIHEGVAIGDQVTIGSEASIFPGVRVYPFKEVETGAQIYESVIWESSPRTRIFSADGVAGLVNVDLTADVAVRLAAALGTALDRGTRVVASRESPEACRMIQRAVITGLTSTGVDVADLRVSPSAVTRHVLKSQGLAAGVHVAQSALDPEQVQIRIYEFPGIQLTVGLQKEIEKYFTRQELRRSAFDEVGQTTYPTRVRESYVQDLIDSIDTSAVKARRFRIAVDLGYSATSFLLPLALGPLGVDAVTAHGFFDEARADRAPLESPSDDAARLVSAIGADLGVVFDRAGERMFLVDERGEPVPVETTLLLFVRLLVDAGRAGTLAVPVTVTSQVDRLVEGSGLEVRRTPHSLSDLTRAAAGDDVIFAGAVGGGYVFPDVVPGYDAVASLCKLLELLVLAERPVSELVAELPVPSLVHRSLPCPWARKGLVMRLLNERLADRELDLLDGIKAFDERGWVQVLPDPDEPLVHVFAEAANGADSGELADELQRQIELIVQGDGVPARTGEKASS
jgi:mannose-1-phosphate guanylyltransferase / phosphomannomutase